MKFIVPVLLAVLTTLLIEGNLMARESDVTEIPWFIGGIGGAYLMVEPGELEVEVFKRNWDARSGRTQLQAILVAPDREVLDSAEIPPSRETSEESLAPVQSVTLGARVDRPGIYALMITSRGNRYGLNLGWSLRTNAAGYLIETSRGHRDERHQEPLVLIHGDRPADVCFLPRPGEFEIEIEGLPADHFGHPSGSPRDLCLDDYIAWQPLRVELGLEPAYQRGTLSHRNIAGSSRRTSSGALGVDPWRSSGGCMLFTPSG